MPAERPFWKKAKKQLGPVTETRQLTHIAHIVRIESVETC